MEMSVAAAEVVVPCGSADFSACIKYFTDTLGFKVKLITPADNPEVVVVQGYGLTLRLDRYGGGSAPLLRLTKREEVYSFLPPPEGIHVEWVQNANQLVVPDLVPSLVLTCMGQEGNTADTSWVEGRAGMLYRDLVPDRQGGRFICSHICVPAGGDIPDYVHYHNVQFQMIFCYKGWIEVVYEDQGPRFRMKAGDCVLQPPKIRHRGFFCSPGLEVIEISCPAKHDTLGDPELMLPTAEMRPDRIYSGQRFVRYEADKAQWQAMKQGIGWEISDTGIRAATANLACARVLRRVSGDINGNLELDSSSEFAFRFVLHGSAELQVTNEQAIVVNKTICKGDAFVIPQKMTARLVSSDPSTQILEVFSPAEMIM